MGSKKGKKSKHNNQYKTSKGANASAQIKDQETSRTPPKESIEIIGQACEPPKKTSKQTELQVSSCSPPKACKEIKDQAKTSSPLKASSQIGNQATSSLPPKESTYDEDQATECSSILPSEETMKHPLENIWNFWFFTNENKKNWIDNLVNLTNFTTAEDYWCLYHAMKCPSELKMGQDYAVFKQGVSPMWEDAANKAGGRWCLNLDKRAVPMIDSYWLDLVLLMIGENFENANDVVCGAVVNIRPRNKLSLWTKTTDEQVNMTIGRVIKSQLNIKFKLQYCIHDSNKILYHC